MQSGIPKAWEVSALNFHGRVWEITYLLTFQLVNRQADALCSKLHIQEAFKVDKLTYRLIDKI